MFLMKLLMSLYGKYSINYMKQSKYDEDIINLINKSITSKVRFFRQPKD